MTTVQHRLEWETGREYIEASANASRTEFADVAQMKALRAEMLEAVVTKAAELGWDSGAADTSVDFSDDSHREESPVNLWARLDQPLTVKQPETWPAERAQAEVPETAAAPTASTKVTTRSKK